MQTDLKACTIPPRLSGVLGLEFGRRLRFVRSRALPYEVGALIRGASREVATEVQDLVREIEGYARDPARLRRDGADLDELRAALKERRVALLAKGIREQPNLYGR